MESESTLGHHFFHINVTNSAYAYSVTFVSNNKKNWEKGRGLRLFRHIGDSSTFQSCSSNLSPHTSLSTLLHLLPRRLPRGQGRDRWSLGDRRAVRHKQSGYQILQSTPAAAQWDPSIIWQQQTHLHITHLNVHSAHTRTHAWAVTPNY